MTAPDPVLAGTNVFVSGEFKSSVIRSLAASFNGAGSAIATSQKVYLYVPVAMKILGWVAYCDLSATLTVDIWSIALASAPPTVTNTIAGTDLIAITAATEASDFVLSGWGTTLIPAGSAVIFNVKTNNNATYLRAELVCQVGS